MISLPICCQLYSQRNIRE